MVTIYNGPDAAELSMMCAFVDGYEYLIRNGVLNVNADELNTFLDRHGDNLRFGVGVMREDVPVVNANPTSALDHPMGIMFIITKNHEYMRKYTQR